MILDQQLVFSDTQAITVTANSSNVIDTMPSGGPNTKAGLGDGQDITLFALVMQAFAGGTSVQIQLISADTADLATNPVVHYDTGAIVLAALTAKARLIGVDLPYGKYRRYLGLKYTVVGTMTAGTVLAALIEDLQTFSGTTDYAKGFSV
ncbi:Bbp16 family capsid cement protein [Paraburkholderia sp. RL17-373-BIF-A]|uniref:Bbp16 family capsid cement protein n=1 Tax=Paraburkholderia sp. RL17-373-BIF-A TaxID=3031629 RepID=UPI0038BE01E6